MEAVIQTSEEQLEILRNMGVEIVATDKDSVIPSPFAHKAIQEEVRRYIRLFRSEKSTCEDTQSLTEAAIHRIKKALDMDGSLSWDEVWEIIRVCDAEMQQAISNE